MKFTSDNLPESVRRKLPQGDPLGYHPVAKREMQQAFDAGTDAEAERKIQKDICNYLNVRGIFYNWQPMNRRSHLRPGTPDFTLSYKSPNHEYGVPIALEAKTETGVLSKVQEVVRNEMVANGWRYLIVRCIQDVKYIFDRLDDRP